MKKNILIIMVITISLLFCSCSSTSQLHQKLIVQGIGIDTEKDTVNLTLQCLKADTSTQDKTEYEIIETTGDNISDAFAEATLKTGKQILLGQCHYLIFGRSAVITGINKEINFFVKNYDFPSNIYTFVSDSKANDVITVKDMAPSNIEQIAMGQKATGEICCMTVKEIASALINNFETPITSILKVKEDKITVTGNVLIKPNSFITLQPKQAIAVNILNNKINQLNSSVNFNNELVEYSLKSCETTVKIEKGSNYKLVFTTYAMLECENNTDNSLKEQIAKGLEENIKATVEKTLNTSKCNVFYLDKYLRLQNNGEYKKLKAEQELSGAEIEVNINL